MPQLSLAVLSIQFRLLFTSVSEFARCIAQLVSTISDDTIENAAEGDGAGHTIGYQNTSEAVDASGAAVLSVRRILMTTVVPKMFG